jgi:hypothetical protein
MGLRTVWNGVAPRIFRRAGVETRWLHDPEHSLSQPSIWVKAKVLCPHGICIFGLHRIHEEVIPKTWASQGRGRLSTIGFEFASFRGNPKIPGCPADLALDVAYPRRGKALLRPDENPCLALCPA